MTLTVRDMFRNVSQVLHEMRIGNYTPWCRILFEKLIVTQLVEKYSAFLWNP
jgi:alkylated DNA nucleotide flippase Atl1